MRRQSGHTESRTTASSHDRTARRIWSRNTLRILSIMVLLLGLVGGGYLSSSRHDQQVASAANARLAQQQKIAQIQAAAYLAAAPQRIALRAAQAAAKASAAKAAATAAAQAKKAQDTARKAAGTTASRSQTARTPTTTIGPIPSSCKAYSGNRAIGCSLVLAAGLGLEQMVCLDHMWTKESNWRTTAENPHSHSYGIPQSLPASKMATFGSDYRTNPATQIKWGLSYIAHRYNTPCGAWSFWQAHNFY